MAAVDWCCSVGVEENGMETRGDNHEEMAAALTELTATLDQLDPPAWGRAPDGATRLQSRVHELRAVPVAALDAEDLRLLITQRVGLSALVPVALAVLRHNPLAEGDLYPGDLLLAVLSVPIDYWGHAPTDTQVLLEVLDRLDVNDSDYPVLDDDALGRAAARLRDLLTA